MNDRQLRVMWWGIAFAILVLLWMPRHYVHEDNLRWAFITASGQVDKTTLTVEIFIIALVTTGGIVTFRDPERRVNCELYRRTAILGAWSCLIGVVGWAAFYLLQASSKIIEEKEAVSTVVVDGADWNTYDSAILDVRLYNPSNTEILHDVVFRLRVHDFELNTDFERRYRSSLWMHAKRPQTARIDLGLPFGRTLKPTVTVEWPEF